MLAFYNKHMNFYPNYGMMLARWIRVIWTRFVWTWPPRPSVLLSVPCVLKTAQFGYLAFFRAHKIGKKKEGKKEDDDQTTVAQ